MKKYAQIIVIVATAALLPSTTFVVRAADNRAKQTRAHPADETQFSLSTSIEEILRSTFNQS